MKTWQKIRRNPQLIDQYRFRAAVIQLIRDFFLEQSFDEVETPLLVKHPGTEPYLEVFKTTLKLENESDRDAFLLTSPEYAMKKLLVAGFENMFQICKSFRNGEGLSHRHNPEFTILEWYRANADYTHIMQDCENLLLYINQKLRGSGVLTYQGKEYDLTTPWEKISVTEAFQKYSNVDVEAMLSESLLPEVARKKNYTSQSDLNWEEAFHLLLLNDIEPNLGQEAPTILYDYPASQAALSRKKPDDPRFAERFEFFLAGLELGNAFTELTDWKEQRDRFAAELIERSELGKEPYGMDDDFIAALKEGMPPSGGIAVGVDRLVMLFADVASITDTLFFPAVEVFE